MPSPVTTLVIALGGAAGALARFWVATGTYAVLGRSFPFGTLVVNVAGSFLMGLLAALLVERLAVAPELRAAILVGFLGAFTTFSTFSIETLNLAEEGAWGRAGLNVVASVAGCVGAAWLGLLLGRQL
jgi:CrcB protein